MNEHNPATSGAVSPPLLESTALRPSMANRRSRKARQVVEGRPSGFNRATRYEIVVRGELDERFASAFDDMTIHVEDGCTRIVGEVVDQSRLYGLLEQINNLGIELISVIPFDGVNDPSAPDGEPTSE
jgi:hypothetical protein